MGIDRQPLPGPPDLCLHGQESILLAAPHPGGVWQILQTLKRLSICAAKQ